MQDDDALAVLECKGNLDSYTFEKLDNTLVHLFGKGCHRVLVDLTDVTHISSAGAGILLSSYKVAQDNGGGLAVVATSPRLLEVFEMLGIATMLNLAPDRDSGFKFLRAG